MHPTWCMAKSTRITYFAGNDDFQTSFYPWGTPLGCLPLFVLPQSLLLEHKFPRPCHETLEELPDFFSRSWVGQLAILVDFILRKGNHHLRLI